MGVGTTATLATTEELRRAVAERDQTIASLQQTIASLRKDVSVLTDELKLFKDRLFGRKADRWSAEDKEQGRLFNEAEAGAQEVPAAEPIMVAAHERRRPIRRPLPASLPREVVIHDIPEEQKRCACGATLQKIGEEVSEKLDIIPPTVKVIRHVRPKYACRSCQGVETEGGAVKIAPPPPQMVPKGIASEGLLAYLLVGKFADALPFYRQSRIFTRLGVDIPRSTMCGWAIEVGQRLEPLLELMKRQICAGPIVQIDETTVQVLAEPGRPATSKSYLWLFCGGDLQKPSLVYRYEPTRSGAVPLEFLGGYRGYVQTDAFSGYEELGRQPGIIGVGCWAHARRRFVEVTKVSRAGGSAAHQALEFIGRLYAVEHAAEDRGVTAEELTRLRQQQSLPVLKEFRLWLQKLAADTPPEGLLGKAVAFTLNDWQRLERYVLDGRLDPDNNRAENALRPFVVGRKNWLFSGTPAGANASAAIYSMIETAKACGHEPYWYLRYLFERLPLATAEADFLALLPQQVAPSATGSPKAAKAVP